ncbi:DegT/DnrJ/EryC1/StrS family aminotransferase [Hwanghaeella sp.]|uniref:DegT/DnrJ/EryC1/StrS family aminotransferase n=1 Tax=Hwanghaeella sp. TaxID=2605943 RepID=UPI003CCBD8E5
MTEPFALAATSWDQREIDAMQAVIDSGMFTMGEKVKAFEQAFAAHFGMDHAIMTNSGSSANLVSTAALSFRKQGPALAPGDEVIVPAISWTTTYTPLQQYGLKTRFVDVELDTLNVDMAKLVDAITPKTKMIMAVSILGNPAALGQMRDLADARGLIFMEDNCESLDAEIAGRKTGTFGDISTASFFFSHHISTMEGGMIMTNDRELAHLCRALRAHGWTRDLPDDNELVTRGDDDLFEAYRFILPGYNVRPLEFSGAVGLVQLDKLPEMTAQRRRNWDLFKSLFEGDERFIIQREKEGRSSAFSFTVILNPSMDLDRKRIFDALTENRIGFRIITGGCYPRHAVIRHFDHSCHDDLPNANIAHDRGFFVGNHPLDLTDQIHRLREVLDRAAG